MRRDPSAGRVRTDALVERLHRQIVGDSAVPEAPTDGAVLELAREHEPLLTDTVIYEVVEQVQARVSGLGVLEPLMADAAVSEVMVNGGGAVWVERRGLLEPTDLVVPEPMLLQLIERIVGPLGLSVDRSNPMVDARLPDGSRVNAVVRPIAVDGPCLTIRRFGARRIELDTVATPGTAALLAWAVRARSNIIVCGGSGAGKTTLLNALSAEIDEGERVVTVEDAAELRLPGRHVIRLEARPPSGEGTGAVRVRELVRNALRMRPDRIIVGEVRAGEAIDMLQAMNTGHVGSLSTCHANSPADAMRRLETLVLMGDVALPLAAVREQLRSAVDLVVCVARTADGVRRITAVGEVRSDVDDSGEVRVELLTDHDGALLALPTRPPHDPTVGAPSATWIDAGGSAS